MKLVGQAAFPPVSLQAWLHDDLLLFQNLHVVANTFAVEILQTEPTMTVFRALTNSEREQFVCSSARVQRRLSDERVGVSSPALCL